MVDIETTKYEGMVSILFKYSPTSINELYSMAHNASIQSSPHSISDGRFTTRSSLLVILPLNRAMAPILLKYSQLVAINHIRWLITPKTPYSITNKLYGISLETKFPRKIPPIKIQNSVDQYIIRWKNPTLCRSTRRESIVCWYHCYIIVVPFPSSFWYTDGEGVMHSL